MEANKIFIFLFFYNQEFWNYVLWTDKTKADMWGNNAQRHVQHEQNTAW